VVYPYKENRRISGILEGQKMGFFELLESFVRGLVEDYIRESKDEITANLSQELNPRTSRTSRNSLIFQ